MYKNMHLENPVSYDSSRKVFETNYNFSFGYPRNDTCNRCDELNTGTEVIQNDLTKNDRFSTTKKLSIQNTVILIRLTIKDTHYN